MKVTLFTVPDKRPHETPRRHWRTLDRKDIKAWNSLPDNWSMEADFWRAYVPKGRTVVRALLGTHEGRGRKMKDGANV